MNLQARRKKPARGRQSLDVALAIAIAGATLRPGYLCIAFRSAAMPNSIP